MFSSIPALCPAEVNNSLPQLWQPKYLQTLPRVLLGTKSPLFEDLDWLFLAISGNNLTNGPCTISGWNRLMEALNHKWRGWRGENCTNSKRKKTLLRVRKIRVQDPVSYPPVVDTMLSGLSLQSFDNRLVLPEPVRPMQTRSYSGRAGGGPLQQSALKHCREREKWGSFK